MGLAERVETLGVLTDKVLCRPLPYHLATSPRSKLYLTRRGRIKLGASRNVPFDSEYESFSSFSMQVLFGQISENRGICRGASL
jgi:hypothetical protein